MKELKQEPVGGEGGERQWLTLGRGRDLTQRMPVPGHIGLEKQSVSKGSIRVHIQCDVKGDLELEKGETNRIGGKKQPDVP